MFVHRKLRRIPPQDVVDSNWNRTRLEVTNQEGRNRIRFVVDPGTQDRGMYRDRYPNVEIIPTLGMLVSEVVNQEAVSEVRDRSITPVVSTKALLAVARNPKVA